MDRYSMVLKKLISQVIVLFLVVSPFISSLPQSTAEVQTRGDDGFWTATFGPEDIGKNVTLQNCIIDTNAITLNYSTTGRIYDFKKDSNHKAYSYVSPFFSTIFFNPSRHIAFEDEFNKYTDIVYIRNPHDGKYAVRSSAGLKKYVVHHFRFKINPDTLDTLEILWRGKADNDDKIRLYYWYWFPAAPSIGMWLSPTYGTSNGSNIQLKFELDRASAQSAINSDNYIDICVVCKPNLGVCTLYSDYIRILSKGEKSYTIGTGFAETTEPIYPENISGTEKYYWEALSWEDYERNGATVSYQVLFLNSSGNYSLVEDRYLPGNKNGFTESPVYLHTIPATYKKLKIRANLTTTTETASPRIYRWTVTWQTLKNNLHWQDLFYSDYRVDTKRRASIESGYVTINPVTGNWPMFGQNPENTRSSEGNGPTHSELNWFAVISEGKKLTNQMISENALYVTYEGSKDMYIFDTITITPPSGEYEVSYSRKLPVSLDKELIAAPTITDQYLIVATGATSSSGAQNYIFALDRNNNLNQKWKFTYNDKICYWASPAVYEDKIFVTSWSGDTDIFQSNSNNKLIALALDRHGDLSNNDALWIFSLPAKSVSTPAVTEDMVVVACANEKGDSIFAVDITTGKTIWNQSVGAVNKSSPVIYKDMVFIMGSTGFKTTLTALSLTDGRTLWSQTITSTLKPGVAVADSTPAVANDVVYVASPTGKVFALNVSDGSIRWSREIYSLPFMSTDILTSSPAIVDDVIYIGTPEGKLFALKTSNGENMFSPFTTFQPEFVAVPIVTSPVVSNGLVFFGDKNGFLYSLGSYRSPTDKITGYIISRPIYLPKNYWWKNFYAVYDIPRNSTSSIVFTLLDNEKNVIKTLQNNSILSVENRTLDRVLRLRADFAADNITVNPKLLKWNITFQADTTPPLFVQSRFKPDPNGWLNVPTPTCSIFVWDNDTGLVVTSAMYTIEYTLRGDATVYSQTFKAHCPGVNGTRSATLTANISGLDFSRNISSLKSIYFSVIDLAGNPGRSATIVFKQDLQKPASTVNMRLNNSRFNTSTVLINATANDLGSPASGVARVELVYRFSKTKRFSGQWKSFGSVFNTTKPKWNITAVEGGGYYELSCVATDKSGNVENQSDRGDVVILFDSTPPDKPVFEKEYSFNDLPRFSVEFKDDFQIHSIWYRPNFETTWTLIDEKINSSRYSSSWTLKTEFWNTMDEDIPYYLFFLINDTLNNIRRIEHESDALKLVRDSVEPVVDIDIPQLDFQWNPSDNFTIKALALDHGSGLKHVQLFYRYSDDNTFDNVSWKMFGESLKTEPFSWNFNAAEGNGFYQFFIRAEDMAGNIAESRIFSTGVHVFPTDTVALMAALLIVFVITVGGVFVFLRRKKAG